MSELAVSIVTYDTPLVVLGLCLESMTKVSIPFSCCVIDNSSSAEIEELVEEYVLKMPEWGNMEYIANPNTGYGRGHNLAMEQTLKQDQYKYHLAINPDVYFDPGTLARLKEYMDERPDVGIVMPEITYIDGSLQRLCKLLPSARHLIARRFLPFLAKRYDYRYQLEFADHTSEIEVPCTSGCFMFMRTETLRKIGIFDPRFFLYFEDVDLIRRIGEKYRVMYYPEATVAHHCARSSYHHIEYLKYHIMGALKYFFKWGWLDLEKRRINREALDRLGYKGDPKKN